MTAIFVAILPMVLLGVNGPTPTGFAAIAWGLSWLASIPVISYCVPYRVWARAYKAYPPGEYVYGFENPLNNLLWGFGASWACGIAVSILRNILYIPPATQWMLAYSLFVMSMVGVATLWVTLNPVPAKYVPYRPSTLTNPSWTSSYGMAKPADLDSVDERLKRIERSLGTGVRGSLDERLERIERSIR